MCDDAESFQFCAVRLRLRVIMPQLSRMDCLLCMTAAEGWIAQEAKLVTCVRADTCMRAKCVHEG